MKIDTDVLKNFLKKAQMSGDQTIMECIVRFEAEGVKINANAMAAQSRVMAWLKPSAFKVYEAIGNVGVNDLPTIIKILDRFKDVITLKKEGNLLTIAGDGKRVEIELVSETFLATDTGEPPLQFEDVFSTTASKLKSIFDDVKINKDSKMHLTTEDKKVRFKNTGKYKFDNEFNAPTCKGGVEVCFGQPLIDCLANLDGNLEVSVKTKYPAKIMEKTEHSIITVLVAPRVDEE